MEWLLGPLFDGLIGGWEGGREGVFIILFLFLRMWVMRRGENGWEVERGGGGFGGR